MSSGRLSQIIEVQKLTVLNVAKDHPGAGSTLEISTSDVGSSYGLLADLLICDELTHWPDNSEGLWHSIISTAAKRDTCIVCVIANAGYAQTWQWNVRETARTDESWHFSRLDGPVASWLSEKTLAEQRRMLPPLAYSRLWENLWADAGGDALSREVIEAAFKDDLLPMTGAEGGYFFIAGLDLGLKRDNAAVCILAVPSDGSAGRIRLAHHHVWTPTASQKIDLLEVEKYLLALDERFNLECVGFDPWQAEHLAQTLEADNGRLRRNQSRRWYDEPFMREVPPTPANLRSQASLTIEFFNDGRLDFYPCDPLHRDLTKLRVEEKSYGFRLVSPRDGDGHGDLFSSFANALLLANDLGGKERFTLASHPLNVTPGDYWAGFSDRQREYEREIQDGNAAMYRDDDAFLQAFNQLSDQSNPFSHFN